MECFLFYQNCCEPRQVLCDNKGMHLTPSDTRIVGCFFFLSRVHGVTQRKEINQDRTGDDALHANRCVPTCDIQHIGIQFYQFAALSIVEKFASDRHIAKFLTACHNGDQVVYDREHVLIQIADCFSNLTVTK